MSTETGLNGYDCKRQFEDRIARSMTDDHEVWRYDALLSNRDCRVRMADGYWGVYTLMYPFLANRGEYTVLELGSGFGRNAPFLSMFECAEYVGVEREPNRLAYARMRYDGQRIRFCEGDACDWRGGQFDVVVCCTIMQHFILPDKLRLLETCKTCRKEGGIILFQEGRIMDTSRENVEAAYVKRKSPEMIPMCLADLRVALAPLIVRHVDGCVWIAEGTSA